MAPPLRHLSALCKTGAETTAAILCALAAQHSKPAGHHQPAHPYLLLSIISMKEYESIDFLNFSIHNSMQPCVVGSTNGALVYILGARMAIIIYVSMSRHLECDDTSA